MDVDQFDPKKYIIIKGARVNNLKNLSVAIPRDQLVVITGLSGSGKSSLAFDTLFAEGQRKYVESLSSYARQFLGRMEKPEVDYIKGVSPAIAIEQKVNTRNPRSTVGTTTEIFDYMKLLFARIGKTISPVSGKEVKKDTVTDVVDYILSHDQDSKVVISTPLKHKPERTMAQEMKILLSKGYTRLLVDGDTQYIEDVDLKTLEKVDADILIDRAVVKSDEETQFRLADSVQTAFFEGEGSCFVEIVGQEKKTFSDLFELDGIRFEEPTVNFFSFNNPYGACRKCEGFGRILGIDPDRVIPDKNLSVFEGAIMPWRGETMSAWQKPLLKNGVLFDFPIHRPVAELTNEQYQLLWTGNEHFEGLDAFFKHLESQTHKIQYRVMLSRYRGKTTCPDCRGTRLRKDAAYVKVADKSITDLVLQPIGDLIGFFDQLEVSEFDQKVAQRIISEIKNRLSYLHKVGLGYLTLNRLTSTLSGGEYQRIKLATSLGSALVGSMYVLDEPSIGLHPRDTDRLIEVLKSLRDIGNSVIVVEHEEKIMEEADQIIDIGPAAGTHGGELVFQGNIASMNGNADRSFTTKYLKGEQKIDVPVRRRKWNQSFTVEGARENNLKNIKAEIPIGVMTVVTGVSGSGKSTLIKKIVYPALGKILGLTGEATGKYDNLGGSYQKIDHIEFVDQNPIGKSSRSNPVTYVKAYDNIRQLFADQPASKKNGFKPAHFSFNVDGGRCEVCEGEGTVKIEMQFMADLHLTCENCQGKRFKKEILEVKYHDKDISEVLNLTVEESLDFFKERTGVISKLKPLYDVGLGYVKLGQSSNSLSGGEAQRVKLASFLGKGAGVSKKDHVLFIFDEPTTGLHFHDIRKLLDSLNALIDEGNSVLIIEHNMEVVKNADWIIDLGPEGGDSGGQICFAGLPEDMIKANDNHTARYLREKF
ncbi:MAG: excinuclease ABC subunit UvrA [Cyclobacteriaceae bacterium]|nr:excinuclease ABC subunit UvrA [Cyclobacteriaceae bacterium HetDA_MAG_MS6]